MGKSVNESRVLITGANRGLGLALAREFMKGGYGLLLHGRSRESSLVNGFPDAEIIYGDLRDAQTMDRLGQAVKTKGLDILVNNAGVYLNRRITEISIEEVMEAVNVNLSIPIVLSGIAWPMLERSNGMIININSTAGRNGGLGESVYAASKAGLLGFSKCLRSEAIGSGVRIIDICLGAMATDMMDHRPDFGNLIDPAEAARAIVSLCENRHSLCITAVDVHRRPR